MAFGRLERSAGPQPMADINMTPLIDVMLVLLVIFMIAAPLMSAGLRLQLPRSEAATPGEAPAVLRLALTADGRLHLGSQLLDPAAPEVLDAALAAAARRQPGTEVQLHADQAVPYGRVAELIGRIQGAGLHRIAFVADRRAPAGVPAGTAASR